MQKIVWNDEFSVGVRKMDIQHQRIIRIYNTLVDKTQAHPRSDTVSKILEELVEYASEHFKCEEQLLAEYDHPDLEQQKAEHRGFRKQAGEFCELALADDEEMTRNLLIYLHDWWTDHILCKDKKYAALLEEKRSLSS